MPQQHVETGNIGQGRAIENPEDAFKKAEGVYEDAASKLSDEQRLPMLPQAPDPNPFGGGGGR